MRSTSTVIFVIDMVAKIYKPAKTAMQSGKGNTMDWVLEFVPENTGYIDPSTGWTGSADTMKQLRLKFKTLEYAVNYAKKQRIEYIIIMPKTQKLIKQSYAEVVCS